MFDVEIFGKAAAEIMNSRAEALEKEIHALENQLADVQADNLELHKKLAAVLQIAESTLEGCKEFAAWKESVDTRIENGEFNGAVGEKGEQGERGLTGDAGVGITDAIIDANGALIFTLSDGSTKTVGEVRGKDGANGADGKPGEKGDAGISVTDASVVDGELILVFSDGNKKNLGKISGADGKDGAAGRDGEKGEKGDKGDAGDSVADALIDVAGNLVLTFTDGRTKSLGAVVGKSFEGFDIEYLADTHDIEITAVCAGVQKRLRYPAGGVRPAGYWRDGKSAKAGDVVSLHGCMWIAKVDTTAKPHLDSKDWYLAVQRGRDMTENAKKIKDQPHKPVILDEAANGS